MGPLPSAAPLCFDGEDACFEAIMRGDVPKGSVVVVRYEGPRGAPGMPEMLSPSAALHSPPPVHPLPGGGVGFDDMYLGPHDGLTECQNGWVSFTINVVRRQPGLWMPGVSDPAPPSSGNTSRRLAATH